MGFSQKMALPARAACSTWLACRSVGVATMTAAMVSSARMSSTLARRAPVSAWAASAAASTGSKTAVMRASGSALTARAWVMPMRPAPSSPMLSMGVVLVRALSRRQAAVPMVPVRRCRGRVRHLSRWKIQSWSGWFWNRHLRMGPAMTLR